MTSTDPGLPPPPRRLPASARRNLLLGHPLLLLGSLAVTMASVLIWLLVAAYGIGFSTAVSALQPRTRLPARVEATQRAELATGENVQRTSALFIHQDGTWRAVGYGETALREGDATAVLLPEGAPGQAWIEGLQKFALPLRDLARVALVTLAPGGVLLLWGLVLGWREQRLAVNGQLLCARRLSRWRLPRPLADRYLDRYEVSAGEPTPHRFLSLGAQGEGSSLVLLSPSRWQGAVLLERLFPEAGSPLPGVGGARQLRARMVAVLWALQGALWALFLLT